MLINPIKIDDDLVTFRICEVVLITCIWLPLNARQQMIKEASPELLQEHLA